MLYAFKVLDELIFLLLDVSSKIFTKTFCFFE